MPAQITWRIASVKIKGSDLETNTNFILLCGNNDAYYMKNESTKIVRNSSNRLELLRMLLLTL